MSRFHQICWRDVTLTEHRTVAETSVWGGCNTVFSADPLPPGDTFSVRVNDEEIAGQSPHSLLHLGVTEQSPHEWLVGGKKHPVDMEQTRSMNSMYGHTQMHGQGGGYCERWRERFGRERPLSAGDMLSVSLCSDRSLSITYNNTEVTRVFTNLPDKPLWVVIRMTIKKLGVLRTGVRTLKCWCCRIISNSIEDEQHVDQLPLPLKLCEDLEKFVKFPFQ